MTHSAAFAYTSWLVVMLIKSCKHEFNAPTILSCGRQCNAKTCIWFQDHLQSPTARLSSTNSRSKLSISPLVRYVADLVSFLCFLLCILQFLTSLIKRASGLSLGTFYQNGALSRHFSHDFPCSPTLLLLFLPSHSLFCLLLCWCLTGLNPYILLNVWLQNGKNMLVIFSSFAPLKKPSRVPSEVSTRLSGKQIPAVLWYPRAVDRLHKVVKGWSIKIALHEGVSTPPPLSLSL